MNVYGVAPGPAQTGDPSRVMQEGSRDTMGRMLAAHARAAREHRRFDARDMRTNALLNDDEWRQFDTTMITTAEERLRMIADLQGAGLVMPLDGLGVMEVEHERLGTFTEAEQTLSGTPRSRFDLPDKDFVFTPVPITHKDFNLELRKVLSSRRRGSGLDVVGVDLATRQVSEKLEDMAFNGSVVTLGGSSIAGLLTQADRNTFTIATAWDAVATNDLILADVLSMKQLLIDDHMFGPYILYVSANWETVMDDDYGTATTTLTQTVRQRLEAVEGISAVRTSDALPDDTALMVQMTRDVVDLPSAQAITSTDWETQGGWSLHFKVWTALTIRVKSDLSGQSGVCHGS